MREVDRLKKIGIVHSFIKELKSLLNAQDCIIISLSNNSIFEMNNSTFQVVNGIDWESNLAENAKFDLILGEFSPWMRSLADYRFLSNPIKTRKNWVEILKSLKFLKQNGTALFVVGPTGFSSPKGIELENILNLEGYYVNAIFNVPEGILEPMMSLSPILALITKSNTDSLFLAELLGDSQAKQVADNYFFNHNAGNLEDGMQVQQRSFSGFHRVKIKLQIEKLETQYKEFKNFTLGEIATEINSGYRGKFIEKENSIYIPKYDTLPIFCKVDDIKNHNNYYQVVLSNKTINEYVSSFFKSELGKLNFKYLSYGSLRPQIYKKDLEIVIIALPSINDQKNIIITQKKLQKLKNAIDEFDVELALNPTNSNLIFNQLDNMLKVICGLTEADKVRSIIRQGESKKVEFKKYLIGDDPSNKKRKEYHQHSVLRTIVAFLNSEGGVLLVGVSNKGEITGIDEEINVFNNNDKFLLHFKDLLQGKIGEPYYPYIEYKLIQVNSKTVLFVECKKSKTPCYLESKEFYVRTNPATDKLDGPKLVEYINNHFNH